MPLDGYDIYMDPDNDSDSTAHFETLDVGTGTITDESTGPRHDKRIMMNPPVEFVQAALAAQPVIPVSNEIVFDQGGQAVMVPPDMGTSSSSSSVDNAQAEGEDEADNGPEQPVMTTPARQTPTAEPTQSASQTQTQAQTQFPQVETAAPTIAAESKSVMEIVTTQVMTATATVTPSSAVTATSETDNPSQTPAIANTESDLSASSVSNISPTSTLPAVRMSSSAPTLSSASPSNAPSSSTSASTTSISTSSSQATSDTPPRPFTQTAPFIFLMVLGSLVLVAVTATLFSTFFRWKDSCGCLPCCRPDHDDEEDGLSDLVRSFDLERTSTTGLSRASSMRSMRRPPPMMDARQVSLQQRSSLFANSPSQAGFLHTQSGVEGSIFESEDEKLGTEHLYGGAGPLEIKNAVEGDIPAENESHAGIGPRHLGVEGNGLEVPWRPSMPLRAYTGSEASYGEAHVPGFGNGNGHGDGITRGTSTLGEYGGPPFPSPPDTINEQPTRASTWASNLRSTLFAAISSNPNNASPSSEPEDRYTRQVLPMHLNRNSTIKSTRSTTDASAQPAFGRNYPMVIDEKDEQELDAADGAIGSRFMMSRDSSSGESGDGASAGTRMSIADRYKSWSRGGGGGAGQGGLDDAWPKPVLAGGVKARGATGQYV